MTDITQHEPAQDAHDSFERVDSFQSLQPGYYWRAIQDTNVSLREWRNRTLTVPAGTVLLLVNVEQFDATEHTVVLKQHPLAGTRELVILVADFLIQFTPEPDGEHVRASEIAELHSKVAELQGVMQRAQSDPSVMRPAIEAGLARWEERQRQDDGVPDGASGQALLPRGAQFRTDISHVLEQRLTEADTRAMTQLASREAAIAEARKDWLTQRTRDIGEKLELLQRFYEEKTAVAMAQISGTLALADQMQKGIASLDLYTGKGVTLECIHQGDGASEDVPLTLMQRKLIAEEELAAWAPVGEDFDFRSMEMFDSHLAENADLRDQLLPFPRCVVSVAMRRQDLDYGDMTLNQIYNRRNRGVFLLVRNGNSLYRVYSHEPTHEFAPRLFPTRNEFDSLFAGVDGARITLQDIRFTQQALKGEDLSLHYRRLLILLAGLDHRLQLFGAFYPAAQWSRFITLDFQQRYLRFIADDEPETQLGEHRPAVNEWMKSRNAYLRSGSRVLCLHDTLLTPDTAPAVMRLQYDRHRDYIERMAEPKRAKEVLIAQRDGNDLFVKVDVERRSWRDDLVQPTFSAKVTLTKVSSRGLGCGFLCLDAVSIDDLEWYIHSRDARVKHLGYIRLFKEVAETLRAERIAEAKTRKYLEDAIIEGGLASVGMATKRVEEGIRAWRADHRGAPLPAVDDRKALSQLLDLMYAQAEDTGHVIAERVEAFAGQQGLVPLKIVLEGRSKVALYVEVPPEERSELLVEWRWVHRLRLKLLKTKVSEASRRLVWLERTPSASEKTLREYPQLDHWLNDLREPLRPHRIEEYAEIAQQSPVVAKQDFVAPGHGIPEEALKRYLQCMRAVMLSGKEIVQEAILEIPVGALYTNEPGEQRQGRACMAVLTARAVQWLKHFASEDQQAVIEQAYIGCYARPDVGRQQLKRQLDPGLNVKVASPSLAPVMIGDRSATWGYASEVERAWFKPDASPSRANREPLLHAISQWRKLDGRHVIADNLEAVLAEWGLE